MSETNQDARVCVGAITGAHGVRGQVRIKSFTAVPKDLGAYGEVTDKTGKRAFALKISGQTNKGLIASVVGVADRNDAQALRGTELYVKRSALPAPQDEEYYHADLIGLAVETPDGQGFGTVREVFDFGAGDMLVVDNIPASRDVGRSVVVPFNREAVPVVDVANARLVVDPLPGLLEPGEPEPKAPDDGPGEGTRE